MFHVRITIFSCITKAAKLLRERQVRVSTLIASNCYENDTTTDGWASTNTARLYTVSSKANKLTAIGCYTLAYLGGYNKHRTGTGCLSMCLDKQSVDPGVQCYGMGCCQTSIAPNLTSFNITFDKRYSNSEVLDFNPCSYAFVAEQDWFRFEASYLEDNKFTEKFKDGVPSVFDWVAGNQSCDEAVKNRSSYACISNNSQRVNSSNATGYLCNCTDGFEGNPYLADGCQGNELSRVQFLGYTSSYLFTDLQLLCTLVWCLQISTNAKIQIGIRALEFAVIQLRIAAAPAHLGLTA